MQTARVHPIFDLTSAGTPCEAALVDLTMEVIDLTNSPARVLTPLPSTVTYEVEGDIESFNNAYFCFEFEANPEAMHVARPDTFEKLQAVPVKFTSFYTANHADALRFIRYLIGLCYPSPISDPVPVPNQLKIALEALDSPNPLPSELHLSNEEYAEALSFVFLDYGARYTSFMF